MSRLGMVGIGQYVPGSSLLHRLDPRVKLLSLLVLIAALFLITSPLAYLLAAVFLTVLVLLARVPWDFLGSSLKPLWFLLLFTYLMHLFFTREGELLWLAGPFSFYTGGVIDGALLTLRILLLVLSASLLTLTTSPLLLTQGLERLLQPLNRLGFPTHEFALMVAIALRFIPTLWQEADKLLKAQLSRGAPLAEGPLWRRVRALPSVIIPLFLSAVKRAEELALAMEARGYRGGEGRTQFRQLRLGFRDYVAFLTACGASGLMLLI